MEELHTLELIDVSKEIRGRSVLDQINITFKSGQVTTIVGENGSGKSMLFRMISGLIHPSQGKLLYNGKELHKEVEPVIGIVIDRAGLFPEFTGYENLKYLAGIRKRAKEDEIRSSLKKVGLDPEDKRLFGEYSLGMKQRLLLAQAIMEDPDILILDEVTNGIDESGKKLIYQIIREEAGKNKIVLLSSHVRTDIEEVSDISYQMEQGHCSLSSGVTEGYQPVS